jgi:hypothetical protein
MLTSFYSFVLTRHLKLHASALLIVAMFSLTQLSAQGTWTMLTNPSPDQNLGVMLLLSDGTVICKTSTGGYDGNGTVWDRLTPDSQGSYVNGTWTSINPMHNSRLYFASQVLKDGRVFVAGGEYGPGGSYAETLDPVTGIWTQAPNTTQYFGDANSEILSNGNVIVGVLYDTVYQNTTAIYEPATNSWVPGGAPTINSHDESSWVKLPDGSILYVDFNATTSERFIPSLGQWIADANVPVSLYDSIEGETGPGFLLPDGRAFFLGSPGHTAYYTPSGNTSPGSWAAGPDIPAGYGCADATGTMMANGIILFDASPIPTATSQYASPTVYYEFNYLTNSYTQVNTPPGANSANEASYVTTMLDLPDGTVMYAEFNSNYYWVYTPSGAPLAAGKPTIDTVIQNSCDSFTITGTLFNGITEGAAYGDDWQMATNYPIIRLTQGSNVYYASSFNWNRTGVQTGSLPDTAQFKLPSGLPTGTYSLQVIANGNSSAPVSFTPPVLPYLTSTLAPPAICTGTLFTYNASASAGATYTWTRPAIPGISDSAITVPQTSNPNEVLVNTTYFPLTVFYNYTISNNGCSIIEQVPATVISLPDTGYITANGFTTLCIGNYLSLQDNVSGNSSLVWSVTGDTVYYENVTQSGDYYVVNTNICGTDTSNHIVVTSLPYQAPTVLLDGYLYGTDTICSTSSPIAITGTPLGGILIYNGNDTLANGLVISPDSAYLGYAYPFSYYYTDNNGCSNTASEYVLFEQCTDTVLAVKNIAGNAVSLTFYPNPASDLINVKADGLTSGSYTLSLNNTDGQVVSIQRINVTGNILDTRMNMQNISAGIYFLSLSSETVRETIKVVKY